MSWDDDPLTLALARAARPRYGQRKSNEEYAAYMRDYREKNKDRINANQRISRARRNGASEKAIKEVLKKYLREIGAYYFMPVQTGYGQTTVDFLVCWRGRFYAIETKKEEISDPTPRQAFVMSAVIASGGQAWVENSVKLEKTKELLL